MLCELNMEDSVVFDGGGNSYYTAVIGYDQATGRVVYDYEKMIEYQVNQGMTEEEAIEWIDYNTLRALPYAGPMGPIVLMKLPN